MTFVNALFTAGSAACVTGLTVVDTSLLRAESCGLLVALMVLGSVTFLSATVPALRRLYIWRTSKRILTDPSLVLAASPEYQALGIMMCAALVYPLLVIVPTFLIIGGVIHANADGAGLPLAGEQNSWWAGFFHAVSSFCNAGFGLHSANMIPFRGCPGVLLPMMAATLLGNTCYPLGMRALISSLHWARPSPGSAFALEKPRRVFTHMFRGEATRVLGYVALLFLAAEVTVFLILEYNEPLIARDAGPTRFLIASFQAVSTRTAGFNTVDLGATAAAMQLLYCVLMYVSSYPVVLSMRATSVAPAKVPPGKAGLQMTGPDLSDEHEEGGTLGSDPCVALGRAHATAVSFEADTTLGGLSRLDEESFERRSEADGAAGGAQSYRGSSVEDFNYDTVATNAAISISVPQRAHGGSQPGNHHSRTGHRGDEAPESFVGEREWGGADGQADGLLPVGASPHAALGAHARRLLRRELPALFLALFAITIAEKGALAQQTGAGGGSGPHFGLWAVIFEVVSAFGTVGLSLGYPGTVESLSAQFGSFSKVVMVAVMLAGRHRGLPSDVDASVALPADDNAPPMRLSSRVLAALAASRASIGTIVGTIAGGSWVGSDAAPRARSRLPALFVSSSSMAKWAAGTGVPHAAAADGRRGASANASDATVTRLPGVSNPEARDNLDNDRDEKGSVAFTLDPPSRMYYDT